ncbi:hypothetical protein [Vampirovibrio chlorellavorus]|uniref:hypothetical protein n=1 Tax=Vampirovibrio chlorellavorus TaxID=758823 RepID=UPI0026F375F7|nr:hypothetical protein [Vampirovibrio chlorellavorus]
MGNVREASVTDRYRVETPNPVTHAVRRVILKQTEHGPPLRPEPLIHRPGAPL